MSLKLKSSGGGSVTLADPASTASDYNLNLPLQNDTLATKTDVANASPAGKVAFFANSSAPTGWMKANGAAVSRTTYAALFLAIGTTYGTGDGSTTFNLPDLRGEFVRGWDDSRGVDSGRAIGSTQLDQFQGHNHNIIGRTNYNSGGSYGPTGSGANNPTVDLTNSATTPENDGTNGNPRYGSETRPRNVAMLACIKY